MFTHSSNPHRSLDSNRAFQAELEEALAQVAGYSEDPTLKVFLRVCEGLILKWQRAYFDSLIRGGKRASVSGQVHVDDANRPKRVRAEQGAYTTSDDNHCEGCGIPRHRRDQCQLGCLKSSLLFGYSLVLSLIILGAACTTGGLHSLDITSAELAVVQSDIGSLQLIHRRVQFIDPRCLVLLRAYLLGGLTSSAWDCAPLQHLPPVRSLLH